MDSDLLKTLGQLLGIGGLALGVFLLLFREVIRKSIFPTLKKDDAFRLVRLMVVLIWSVAVIGIGAWIWGAQMPPKRSIMTTGDQGPVIQDTSGDARIEYNAPGQLKRP
jgi:hypothetical protein